MTVSKSGVGTLPMLTFKTIALWLRNLKDVKYLVIVIVFIALFLDNMLLTTIVAIVPELLYKMNKEKEHRHHSSFQNQTNLLCHYYMQHKDFRSKQFLRKENKKYNSGPDNAKAGILFASKAVVQLITNPFIGLIINRIGYTIPMFSGLLIMCASTILFTYGRSYATLFVARAVQGFGSSCSSVAGLSMVADRFVDQKERGKYMGIALGGLALGVLVGPPFGGIMFQHFGMKAPFHLLTCLGALNAGALAMGNLGIAMMEPFLPLWMLINMNASESQQGMAFVPASLSYMLGTNLFGTLAFRMGRWLCCLLGLLISGISLICIPFATSVYGLIVPNGALGIAIGMVDASIVPTFGYLVDIRHSPVYGSVYAINDVALCLGYAIGPLFGGFFVRKFGFPLTLVAVAIFCFIYSPLLLFLRNPPAMEAQTSLLHEESRSIKFSRLTEEY